MGRVYDEKDYFAIYVHKVLTKTMEDAGCLSLKAIVEAQFKNNMNQYHKFPIKLREVKYIEMKFEQGYWKRTGKKTTNTCITNDENC